MELKFKQIDETHIKIIAVKGKEEKEVGHIFSPSGSGEDTINAIQVCGFTEAFDLWGCAVYGKQAYVNDSMKYRVVKLCRKHDLEETQVPLIEQVKDIQLKFDWETHRHISDHHKIGKDCLKCYNEPCTCEVNIIHENPYTVKRSQDLYLEHKKEHKKESPK